MKKLRIISLLSVFALCLCTLGIGVWAAKQTSFSSSGNITFNAIGVQARISGTITGAGNIANSDPAVSEYDLPTVEIDTTSSSNLGAVTGWQNDLSFKDANGTGVTDEDDLTITMTLTFINDSALERTMWVYIEDQINEYIPNLVKTVSVKVGSEYVASNAFKVEAGEENAQEITITFAVHSMYNGIGDASYNYKINLYDESSIPDASLENITYIPGGSNSKLGINYAGVYAEDNTITTAIIQPIIKVEDEIYVVTSTGSADPGFSGCKSLTYVFIPDTVTYIGFEEFYQCSSLTNVRMSHNVTIIDGCSFADTAITNIMLPNTLTAMEYSNFSGTDLVELYLPFSLTTMSTEYPFFEGCGNLASIIVEEGNPVYKSVNNCLIEIETGSLLLACTNSSIPLDGSVTSIGHYCFANYTSSSITIPASVTSIGGRAFGCCTNLTTINYTGTQEQWNAISIDNSEDGNAVLSSATINYNYKGV